MYKAVISEQGRREAMEDTYFLDDDFNGKGWTFGGIYDGHGGKYAAEYASRYLHRKFIDWINKNLDYKKAFIKTYEQISRELRNQDSGTTAANFFIKNNVIYTANTGDTRIIVISKRDIFQLTVDHRVDNPDEVERIENAGGIIQGSYVTRGNIGLMPTRTLGDEYFKSVGIIATPSVNEHRITPDDLILLAGCDGLFDVMNNEEISGLARHTPDIDILLEVLKKEVLINRYGTDNLSIIAMALVNLIKS